MSRAAAELVAVAVLTKAPVPGFAKTRLVPALGNHGAAFLQEQLTARAVATACAADVGPVTLWASPDTAHASFRALARQHAIALARQPDGDLGARMLAAIEAAERPALVIGTDCPSLTPEHLRAAAGHLHDGLDAALIPAEDGGYVLIGMREPQPAVFAGMTWSTETVATETRRRLAQHGLAWREPARLWDIDRPEDIDRLQGTELQELLPGARLHRPDV